MDHYAALTSYQVSAVMMTGAQTGLFRCLQDGEMSTAEIAESTGLSLRGTDSLLRSLNALGYVSADGCAGQGYRLTNAGKLLNETGSEGLSRLAIKESYFYQLWSYLGDAVRSGTALLPPFSERVKRDGEFVKTFLLALNDLACKGADGFFAAVNFDGVRRLVDFGGGAAGYATLIARRYPGIHITLVDLPEIVPLANSVVRQQELTNRIDVVAGDVFTSGLGLDAADFDAALVSHLLHDFDEPLNHTILRHACEIVKPGGRLIVNDVFTGAGPLKLPETFFDLMMLVENPGGGAHPLEAVQRWLLDSGWLDPTYQPLYFGGVLQARRGF